MENLQEISVCLQLNLSSASHLVRLLSLRILASLDHEESATELKVLILSSVIISVLIHGLSIVVIVSKQTGEIGIIKRIDKVSYTTIR